MDAKAILETALKILEENDAVSAVDAIVTASLKSSDSERKNAMLAFEKSLREPEVGCGANFQKSIVENALLKLSKQYTKVKNKMTDTKSAPSADTIVSKGKKYTVGDVFSTVAVLSLQPTDQGRKAKCAFQFSRKAGRTDIIDAPVGTSVKYIGVRAVYEGQASTKRMIFLISKGSTLKLNGNDHITDADIEVAGVVNHIDPEHDYNK